MQQTQHHHFVSCGLALFCPLAHGGGGAGGGTRLRDSTTPRHLGGTSAKEDWVPSPCIQGYPVHPSRARHVEVGSRGRPRREEGQAVGCGEAGKKDGLGTGGRRAGQPDASSGGLCDQQVVSVRRYDNLRSTERRSIDCPYLAEGFWPYLPPDMNRAISLVPESRQ